MNETVIDQIIERNPKLKGLRQKLEAMRPGTYCLHPSWGFGKISAYEPADNRLIIDFEADRQGHAMDPAFCADKLELLKNDSLLVRKHTETAVIEDLAKNNPAELIAQALATFPNQTASSGELERLLAKVVGETRFKKWWLNARKQINQDARIACPSRKTEPYILRDEPIKIEDEILENFYAIRNPREQILIAEKLLHLSGNVEAIESDLPKILEVLTEAIQNARQLSDAERLHGVWVRNDLARHLEADVETLEPTSSALLERAKDRLADVAEALPPTCYKRFLNLLTRVYPDNWVVVVQDLLRTSSGKFTQECMAYLVDQSFGERLQETLLKWLDEQSLKGPLITWIFKNRDSRKFAAVLKPLLTPRLLGAALYAIDYEALQLNTNRRIPLAEYLSDDAALVSDLLANASPETAHDLAHALLLSQGFEELTKKSLLARFIKRFPTIQSLLTSDGQKETERLIVSAASYEGRKKEYEVLISEKLPENKQAIVTAREHGDLKENSEYKMARQDQEILLARKALLESELARAVVTDFTEAPLNAVGIGSIVELIEGSTNKTHHFAILGAWDSDPTKNVLSYKTPLGQVLLSKKIGETVETVIGDARETWQIKGIKRWVDENA